MTFGDFSSICDKAALPLCPLVGSSAFSPESVIQPKCYSRTIQLANTTIFQGAASFAHIFALIMTVIMILHVRSKFTAVGRKEITTFFYIYMLLTVFSLIVDSGVSPPGSGSLPYFVAVQIGLASAACISLCINGFLGFQVYEDGTTLSVWLLRGLSTFWFGITFIVALLTFQGWAGLSPRNTVGLFVVMYIMNALLILIYVAMQILLVVGTLQDRWPLGDIIFGVFFFVLGQVILYTLGETVCERAQHYVDGLFFATVCNLLAVMMVYKYWDSITTEDLEFSVGTRVGNWDVKDFQGLSQDDPFESPALHKRGSTIYGMGGSSDFSNSNLMLSTPRHSHIPKGSH